MEKVSSQLTDDEQRLLAASKMGLVEYRVEEGDVWFYIGDTNVTGVYLGLVMKGINLTANPNVKISFSNR